MDENEGDTGEKREDRTANSCCSFQNRLGPPEYRKWRRIHGLQLPLHPQQVMGWIVLFGVGMATFLVLIPALSTSFQDYLLVILAVLFFVHILSHIAALLLDPADPELRKLKVKVIVPEFDKTKHAHVIENGRCHLCNIKTKGPRTKHCSVCNKCIDKFDHHCKWLNHCVGGRNYMAFLICVITAVGASLIVVGISVLEIIYYHTDPGLLSIFPDRQNGTSAVLLPESVFLGVVGMLALLAATTSGLLLHLCLFHCYISILGITTYEYIRNYRQGATANTFFPYNFTCKRSEVVSNCSNASDQAQNNRRSLKFENGCCYSCSRPPETNESEAAYSMYCDCFYATAKYFKCDSNEVNYPGKKVRKLERQDTDPEFIDRVVKPFVIALPDDKREEETEGGESSCDIGNTLKGRGGCFPPNGDKGGVSRERRKPECPEANGESLRALESGKVAVRSKGELRFGKFWRLCSETVSKNVSVGSGDPIARIKCNQIRPKSEEDFNRSPEKMHPISKSENNPDNLRATPASSSVKLNELPELSLPVRKLQNPAELRELTTVLDIAEQPNFALQRSMKASLRRGRKKVLIRRPRSPSLSPIRESGLSNPGSPRVNAISPVSTPTLTRASSLEISTIFLSNPNSPCSSDEDTSSSSPTPRWNRKGGGDILETPQLPRKRYPGKDPVFVVKSPKLKPVKWIDLEIREGI